MKAIGVFTGKARFDLELQIVVHTAEQVRREVKDLKAMGCENVKTREFESEAELYAWYEKNR